MSGSKDSKDYSSISLTRMELNLTAKDKLVAKKNVNWLDRKMTKIKKVGHECIVVGKAGFLMGGAVGCCLGLVFGGIQSVQQRSIWPLPLAMLISSFSFACIFGISQIVRLENDTKNLFTFELVIYDPNEKKYIRKNVNYLHNVNKI